MLLLLSQYPQVIYLYNLQILIVILKITTFAIFDKFVAKLYLISFLRNFTLIILWQI